MRLQPVDGDTECYQADPRISSLQCGEYRTSTDYTLTHLAPTDDLTYLSLISNAVPQFSNYYNIIWSEWEKQLMNWTDVYGTLHVITGCLLDSDGNGHRDPDSDFNHWLDGEGSVAVPSGFYSIVTRCVETTCPVSSLEALGLLLHHRNFTSITNDVAEYLKFRLSTVTDIESATGINFFPNLSPEQQATLKLHIQTALWA
jgi:endonuclease G